MAAADLTATFQAPIRGDDAGDYDVFIQWAITAPILYTNPILLVSGDNTIQPGVVGPTYQLLVIIPPASALTDSWHLKGVAGDTGISIPTPGVLIFANVNTSLGPIINATTGGYTIITRWLR